MLAECARRIVQALASRDGLFADGANREGIVSGAGEFSALAKSIDLEQDDDRRHGYGRQECFQHFGSPGVAGQGSPRPGRVSSKH